MEKHSLSWYKKRVAALNKIMGSEYRPTQIYKAEQVYHTKTEIGYLLAVVGDPRSQKAAKEYESGATIFMRSHWAPLSANNRYVNVVLSSIGQYISKDDRTIYFFDRTEAAWYEEDIATLDISPLIDEDGAPTTPPKSAIRLTAREAEKRIEAKAEEIKPYRNRRGESINNYVDI